MSSKASKAKAAEPKPTAARAAKKAQPAAPETQIQTAPDWALQIALGMGAKGGAAASAAGSSDTPGPFGVLVDGGLEAGPGQIGRDAFMERLEARIRAAADAELASVGKTARDCPYLETWLAFYRDKPAAHLERAIARYTRATQPSAETLAEAVEARVRSAINTWKTSGELTGIPSESPLMLASRSSTGGGPPAGDEPLAVATRLGPGRPLESGVRSRMERGLGTDLGHVRLHDDATGAGLSQRVGARAFAVGEHVAFGAGEYRPGTLVGDAILAHELAHTRQQQGAPLRAASTGDALLERNADRGAAGAMARLWGGLNNLGAGLTTSLSAGGLKLSRCGPTPLKASDVTPDISVSEEDEVFLASIEDTEDIEQAYDLFKGNQKLAGVQAGIGPNVPGGGAQNALIYSQIFMDIGVEAGELPSRTDLQKDEKVWKAKKDRFEKIFEKVAVGEAYTELARHEKLVQGELDRYNTQPGLDEIRTALAPYKTVFEKVKSEKEANLGHTVAAPDGTPVYVPGDDDKVKAANALTKPARDALAAKFPIVAADDLDIERILLAPEAEARNHLIYIAQGRIDSIQKARGAIQEKPSRVWKFDRAVQLARKQLGVEDESVFDMMIKDRNDREAWDDMFKNLLIGALALGLGLVSAGTGTVAVLAGAAGAGISTGLAAAHVREFLIAEAAAGTAFDKAQALSSQDPSLFWLAVDVVVAFVDIAVAAKAFTALKPVAQGVKTLEDAEKLRGPAKAVAEAEKVANPEAVAEQVVQEAKKHVEQTNTIKTAEAADKAAVDAIRAVVKDEAAVSGLIKINPAVRSTLMQFFKGSALEKLGRLVEEYPGVAKVVEGLHAKLPSEKFIPVMGKYLLSRGSQSKFILRAAADAGLTDADFQLIADALKNVKSSKQVARQIGGLLIERIAERLPGGADGIAKFRQIAPGLHPNQSAQIFERWAARNIYGQAGGAERFSATTEALSKEYAASKPNFKGDSIKSDDIVRDAAKPNEAGLVDFKSHLNKRNLAADADAVKQADNYKELMRVGAKSAKGEKFTWVEYLFANRDSAEASFKFLKDKFGDSVKVFFVDDKGAKTLFVPAGP